MLPRSIVLIRRLLQQDPIYVMQPQYSRDSYRTLVLSIIRHWNDSGNILNGALITNSCIIATIATLRYIPERRLKQICLQLMDIPTRIRLITSIHASRQAVTSFFIETALSPGNRSFRVMLLAHLLKQNTYNYQ
jgi:hypothetical protein